jgi:mono/diheme cytochrome c family protein/DNA-binding beta-propeller fold protein YncE
MSKSRSLWFLVPCALAACDSSGEGESPSPTPPPPWGVPISGGNMLITRGGDQAVLADPDRDRLMVVTLASGETRELPLNAGDEPGRLVEDGAGRVHIALRRGGALVTYDVAANKITARRPVCPEPRGLAWDQAKDQVHVACSGGELVSLPAAGGGPARSLRLERDLRDVLVDGTSLVVTTFRTAEVLTLDATGQVATRQVPPTTRRSKFGLINDPNGGGIFDAVPAVAWRTVALPDGGYLMSHQRTVKGPIDTKPGGYDGGCGNGPAEPALSVIRPGQAPFAVTSLLRGSLPVDVAVNPRTGMVAVAMAGGTISVISNGALGKPDDQPCPTIPSDGEIIIQSVFDSLGAPTSIGWTQADELVTFFPEFPGLMIRSGAALQQSRFVELPGELGYDSGRALFHKQTSSGMSCASCHPEGREDGQVWEFADLGLRRTQSLAGGIMRRAPYHWGGDMTDLPKLMGDVFSQRMGGGQVSRSEEISLGPWLDRVPAPAPSAPLVPDAVARGKQLFDSASVGCATCHSGALLTNNLLVGVNTDGVFKVPSLLGVAARAPFMHDGCAETLMDRFGPCGGGDRHGATSQLSPAQLADLVSYLESL